MEREWKGAQGLAEDVRYYGQWMRDEAEKRIGHLYPKIEVTADMIAGTEAPGNASKTLAPESASKVLPPGSKSKIPAPGSAGVRPQDQTFSPISARSSR